MRPMAVPHHDTELLAAKVESSQLGETLAPPAMAAITSIIVAPMAFSYVTACTRSERPEIYRELRKLKVPRLAAWTWLRGLVEGGHSEGTLAGLSAAGMVQPWGLHSGQCITLSPLCAQVLELELIELTDDDPMASRWAVRRPRRDRIRRRFAVHDPEVLMGLVDGAPHILDQLIDGERWTKGGVPMVDELSWDNRPITIGGFPILMFPAKRGRPPGKKTMRKNRRRRRSQIRCDP